MYTIKESQFLPISLDEAWKFFSSPGNLKVITPSFMGFDILSKFEEDKMHDGQIIKYRIRPLLNIPMVWVSELKDIKAPNYFVDEQKKGPYKYWHHQHFIKEVDGGVLVEDKVSYSLPFGFLGKLAHAIFVKKQLKTIFNFRRKKLEELFGS